MAVATGRGAFIGGEWLVGDGEEIDVTNPYDGSLVGRVTQPRPPQVDAAVAAARAAFPAWRARRCRSASRSAGARSSCAASATRRSPS